MRRISPEHFFQTFLWGLFSAVSSAILLAVVCEMGCSPSVGADGTGTVLFVSLESINLSSSFMPPMIAAIIRMVSSSSLSTLAPSLIRHSSASTVASSSAGPYTPGIALHYHVPAQEPLGDVVLLRQAREPHSGVDLLVFLRGYPEGHGLVPPAVVSVQILS